MRCFRSVRPLSTTLTLSGVAMCIGTISAAFILEIPDHVARHLTFVTSAGLAVTLAGVTLRGRWRSAGLLGAIALLGQAAVLEMYVDTRWLQRFPSWSDLTRARRGVFAAIVLVQAFVVAGYAWRTRPRGLGSLLRPAVSWRGLTVGLALVFSAVCVMPFIATADVSGYAQSLVVALAVLAIGSLNLLLLAREVPYDRIERVRASVEAVFSTPRANSRLGRGLRYLAATWVCLFSSAVATTVFEATPQIPDDVSMYWQAKYFAAGKLYLDPPPSREAFHQYLIVNDGQKWYAHSTPGWPAILALGFLAGVPWIVNPIIGGLTVLAVHRCAWRLYGWRTAQLAVVLLAASPWFIVMSATYLAHSAALFWGVLSMASAEALRRTHSLKYGVAAGACLGLLFMTRPFEGLLVGSWLVIWIAWRLAGPVRAPALLACGSTAFFFIAATLSYNRMVTGSYLLFPTTTGVATEYDAEQNRFGFGSDRGFGWTAVDPLPGHGIRDILINANHNLYWLQFESFAWPSGSLAVLAVGFVLLRPERRDWLWIGLAATVVFGHSFYWFSGGPDYGARYWYQVLPAIVLLTARWFVRLTERSGPLPWTPRFGVRATIALTGAVVIATVVVMPWRATNKYPGRRGMQSGLAKLEKQHDWSNALIFIDAGIPEDYSSAFIRNSPDTAMRAPLYVRHLNEDADSAVSAAFPDRVVWKVSGPARSTGTYRVVAGPTSTASASIQATPRSVVRDTHSDSRQRGPGAVGTGR